MVDRIRLLLQTRQLSSTQFADAIGVARPIISHILSGRNKPSLEVVQKIIAAFPNVAMPWLLTGQGPMLMDAPDAATAVPAATEPTPGSSAGSTPPRRAPRSTPDPIAAQKERKPLVTAVPPPAAEPPLNEPPQPELPQAAPSPVLPSPPAVSPAAPASVGGTPALLSPAGSGKTIRRVLIFYSDGTFTDFSPAPDGL